MARLDYFSFKATIWRSSMSDNLEVKGPQDSARINVHEKHEVRYWTKALNVSEEELIAAVKAVGVSATAVRTHIEKSQ